jgi:hypothetical protein
VVRGSADGSRVAAEVPSPASIALVFSRESVPAGGLRGPEPSLSGAGSKSRGGSDAAVSLVCGRVVRQQRSLSGAGRTAKKRATQRATLPEGGVPRTEARRGALPGSLTAWTNAPLNARGSAPLRIARLLQAQRSSGNRIVQLHLRHQASSASPTGGVPDVQRFSLDGVIPDAILNPIKSLVAQVAGFWPGHDLQVRGRCLGRPIRGRDGGGQGGE